MFRSPKSLKYLTYLSTRTFNSNDEIASKFISYLFRPNVALNSVGYNFRSISMSSALMKKARVPITFEKPNGSQFTGTGKEGESILDVVLNNELDIQGYGACEGTLSCSTCHIIFTEEDYKKLNIDRQITTDEELDLLDLAPGACSMSRLGCQITVTKEMEGLKLKVPAMVQDQREFPVETDSKKQSGE